MRFPAYALADARVVLGLKVLNAGLMFVTSVVVSRGLGPEGRGVYYTPLLAATTTIALCHLGLDQANVYLFGTRRVPLHRLIGQAGLVTLIAGSLGMLVLGAMAALDLQLFAGVPRSLIVAAAVLVPFGVHIIFTTGLLTLEGRVAVPPAVSAALTGLQLLLIGVLAWIGRFTPELVFAVYAAAIVVTAIVLAAVLPGGSRLFVWDGPLLRESLRHSLVLHLGMALLFLHLRVDMFLVKWIMGTAPLGLYSLAVVLAETVMLAADSLGSALTPRQMHGSVRDGALVALAGVRKIALAGLVAVLAWAVAGAPAIGLIFGHAFRPVYAPLVVLLPGIVFRGMQRICGPTVLRAGRPWTITGLQAAGFALNVLLNLWWIPRAGLIGTAAASTVSYTLIAAAFLAWTARLGETSILAAVPRGADVRAVLAGLRPAPGAQHPAA